jgi:DTW domain-containing protein YfiP
VCYCAALPRLDTATRVVILQHPREREMPIGTARMASLCLPEASLHVGVRWDAGGPLGGALADPARPPILLYPGPGARDILRDPPPGPVTLVVVDGTWSQARTVVRDNPILRALPRYDFVAPEPTQYRIRREPRPDYVSTIEALMHVLGVLEGDAERFRALLDPLRAMVDAHLAQKARAPRPRVRHPRPPRPLASRLPAEVRERFDDLVCVVGEANAWPYRAAERGLGDELVHWVAHRPGSGEIFDVVAAPERPLAPSTCFHTGLAEPRLRGGGSRAALTAGFAGFLRPGDVLCAWGTYAPRLFEASVGPLPAARLDLRAAAQRMVAAKLGALEHYAASFPAAPGQWPDGRAGLRLGLMTAILYGWRRLSLPR